MHIPDGFLAPQVWAPLNAAAVPAIALCARRARRGLEENHVPLLGMMGAFVFAAQMVNFPIAPGTSSHLSGGALLAVLFGPWVAALAMGAVLLIQAVVFQDGGLMAFGANFFNLAIIAPMAAYLPYRLAARGGERVRAVGVFFGAWLSVVAAAAAVSAELAWSGMAPARLLVPAVVGVHALTGLVEGALTLGILRMIERVRPPVAVRATEPA